LSLRELLLASGQSTEKPDRDADQHTDKDDLGDQEEEACCDPNEREEENKQHFPQQDSDHTRGGYAENGLQNGQAPVEAATLRQFIAKSVTTDVPSTECQRAQCAGLWRLREPEAEAERPVGLGADEPEASTGVGGGPGPRPATHYSKVA
jgi:hypothetical protein